MEREALLKLWDECWNEGAWFGSWSKALAGVDAPKAAWKPPQGTHSIWQLVNHVSFWREYTLRSLAGEKSMDASEVARLNFEEPAEPTEEAWAAARARLRASHDKMGAAIAEGRPLERPRYHLVHDANHLGQILYLRAMQGLPPVME